MSPQLTRLSRFLSKVLRHDPGSIGVTLDAAGWTSVDELIAAAELHGRPLTREILFAIVRDNDKQRFALSEDGRRIRASQGHTVEVELGLAPEVPPEILFHGTVERFLDSIRRQGLLPGERNHVHLSANRETAMKVGARRGRPVILNVQAGRMHAAGHAFFRSANGVWLTDAVPPEYLVE